MTMKSLLPSIWGGREENYNPFEVLQNEVDRVFGDFNQRLPLVSDVWLKNGRNGLTPRVDISETDNAIHVTAELPGVEEKDIDVSVDNSGLTIKAEKKAEKEDKNKNYHLVERTYGMFQRTIPLPYEIDADKVDAKFEKGVLTINMPKPAEVKTKKRKVKIQ